MSLQGGQHTGRQNKNGKMEITTNKPMGEHPNTTEGDKNNDQKHRHGSRDTSQTVGWNIDKIQIINTGNGWFLSVNFTLKVISIFIAKFSILLPLICFVKPWWYATDRGLNHYQHWIIKGWEANTNDGTTMWRDDKIRPLGAACQLLYLIVRPAQWLRLCTRVGGERRERRAG